MHTRVYRLLVFFASVVDHGSFSLAASALNVSAPVVSKAISDLEAELETSLLLRGGPGGVQLTESGQQIYDHACAMREHALRAVSIKTVEFAQGRVNLTLPSELARTWLPDIMSRLAILHPDVALTVHSQDLNQQLETSPYDLAVRAQYRLGGKQPHQAFKSIPLVLVAAAEKTGKKRRSLESVFKKMSFIGYTFRQENSLLVGLNLKSKRLRKFRVTSHHHTDSAVVGRELALAGYGVAYVIKTSVQADIDDGQLIDVGKGYDFGYVDLLLLSRDQYPSIATRAVRQLICDI